ncbi:MAG: L,D-transpeptidase [Verrucomicrobiaceae bacterium]|nr:L,D-transpeptidase [Verrucomicrobiaceae bacterium]
MQSPSLSVLRLLAAAAVAAAALTSCSSPQIGEDVTAQGYWIGDRVSGSPKIVIDLSRQIVRYYKGGTLVGAAPISSGREGHGTVRGTYRIMEKDADHRSSLYGSFVTPDGRIVESDVDVRSDVPPPGTRFLGASMRSFMRVTGAIGMHEGYLPGYPASHGCIRLPSRMAAIFYHATPHGTPVEIIGDPPDGHLTTYLPVPQKLRPEDIVLAPSDDSTAHLARGRVALGEPAPPPAPKKTQIAATKPDTTTTNTPSIWSGLLGGTTSSEAKEKTAPASPTGTRYLGSPDPKPISIASAPATPRFGTIPPPPPKAAAPAPLPAAAPEPQLITYKPLASLASQSGSSSSSTWFGSPQKTTPKAPKPAKVPKVTVKKAIPAPRGQTYFLPGYN